MIRFLIVIIVLCCLSCDKIIQIDDSNSEQHNLKTSDTIITEQTLYRFQINGIWYTTCDIPPDDCSVLPLSQNGVDALRSWSNDKLKTTNLKGLDISGMICKKYRRIVINGLLDNSLRIVESPTLDNNPIFVIEFNDKQKGNLESTPVAAIKFVR
ncbi:MAG: hypothetical protein V2A67_07255 [Bacteroidota bacterium]